MATMRSAAHGFGNVRHVVRQASHYSTTTLLTSKKDQSFPTWSFDKPCTSMEWNELVPATLTATADMSSNSDLIIVGIYAPASNDEDDEDAPEAPVVLQGAAKAIDETLGGILSEVINDNSKTFKAGASAGSMTPTVRVATPGGKVSLVEEYTLVYPLVNSHSFCSHSPSAMWLLVWASPQRTTTNQTVLDSNWARPLLQWSAPRRRLQHAPWSSHKS